MPRPNPARAIESEDNLARRIAYERERREWSYESLAKRMTEVGCALQGSAVYKIEKGRPRRRVTVDELVALAQVFDVAAQDLLKPVGLVGDNEAKVIVTEWLNVQRDIGSLVARAGDLNDRLETLARTGYLDRYPVHQVLANGLFRNVREAQDHATAAFELFLREQQLDGSVDPDSAAIVSRARARSGVDQDGRSPTPKGDPR